MFDISLRSLKDRIFNPLCALVPAFITPLHITGTAFLFGLGASACAAHGLVPLSLACWALNRALDCLDGAVARDRNVASDLGGFLDLLGDFIVYSSIPIGCACRVKPATVGTVVNRLWLGVATVEASFHVNNFVLFYVAAVLEKRKGAVAVDGRKGQLKVDELTSVMMRPALIEGMESGVLFTVMLAVPEWTEILCWTMAVLVGVGICQRVFWLVPVLS